MSHIFPLGTWSKLKSWCGLWRWGTVSCIFLHMGSHPWVWDRSLLGSKMGFGSSSLSISIVCVGGSPKVVRIWMALSNWLRAGISIPLVILYSSILLASSILLLIVDCWEHLLVLDVSDIHESCWHNGRNISVWMDVRRRKWQWIGRTGVPLLGW